MIDVMQIISATQHYLGRQSRDCQLLLRIARATACRHQRAHLDAMRIDRKAWLATKRSLCGRIAEGLRADGVAPE